MIDNRLDVLKLMAGWSLKQRVWFMAQEASNLYEIFDAEPMRSRGPDCSAQIAFTELVDGGDPKRICLELETGLYDT